MPTESSSKPERFLALHVPGRPLLMPNPWDDGSARLLEWIGFEALATTSSGFAATLGRLDGGVTRDEAVAHAGRVASAVSVPVSADLQNCFADDPEGVATTVAMAVDAGVAGCSVEDSTGRRDDPLYDLTLAIDRVAAAVEASRAAAGGFVITARAEAYLHGQRDLGVVIERLLAYQQAGAHVLFAPGVSEAEEIRQLVASVERPVNILAVPGTPPVAELAALGVSRVSVGGAFAMAAFAGVLEAARELQAEGTYEYLSRARAAGKDVRTAFSD